MTEPSKDPQASLVNTFGPLDGQRIEGGCQHCDAYQTVDPMAAGAWVLTVHHDDWCPVLKAAQR